MRLTAECPLCSKPAIVLDSELRVVESNDETCTYQVTVTTKDIDAATDRHLDGDCPAASVLRGG